MQNGRRPALSILAVAIAAPSWPFDAARAACTPTLSPTTGQTITCDSSQPNPVSTGIVAQPGATNVTVNMLSGAQLKVGGGDAIVLGGGGQITNNSGAIIQGVRGINGSGPLNITNAGQITGTGGPGVVLGGAGNSVFDNTGTVNGSGGVAVQFNTVAGSTQTFNNTGNGSINGNFVGSGDGAINIVNGGNFNGGITLSGNGVYSITTQAGRNINGQVSITGNAQSTIVNGGAFNNGLVISGAGTNSITNQAGAFINQIFSVTGTQNTINNAGTLNNGLTVGNGVNDITNQAGAFINQTFSVTGTQNTIVNAGTLNNGVTVNGSGVNSITNSVGGVINQALNIAGNPSSTVANLGTINGVINMSGTGSVFDQGAINGSGGTAINFSSGPGPFTLTLAPGFSINGNVLGTGSDTLQLGTSLTAPGSAGTFNVSNIGPSQQYRGFSTFNKIGPSTWTLTGSGAQNWTISGGVLIGDTNSLQGSAITNNAALVFNQGFNGTYAGTIGGGGALTVQGGGTVTFTGSNNYTGGTTISGATLQLGNGGASGSVVGDIVNNGTLVINRSGTFTLDNLISGTGSLVQAGPGTTIVTQNNGYTGATTVAAGTLQVSGSIAGSSGVTVNAGATLSGTGVVAGTVSSTVINAGGTLTPGNNAVGNLSVAGDLAFQSGAFYLVQVSPSSAGNTFVSGATTVAGTLTANALGGPFTTNQIFPVLSSTGSLTGTFNLATTGNFGTANVSLAYSPHEVFLVITATPSGPPVWRSDPVNSNWNVGANWQAGTPPTATDIAQFNNSSITTIDIQALNTQVGGLQFNAGAPAYTFNVTGTGSGASSLIISGSGVADLSGNAPTFVVSGTAGNPGILQFTNSSTADDATIITNAFGQTIFSGNSNGGLARFITNAGGVVDFSGTSGPAGDNRITAASIEGAGTYHLGSNLLVVGFNDLSTTVSGSIDGVGGSLAKVGDGTLILSGTNTYTGLTAVLGGTVQVGDGGTTGSIAGNVFVHTTFAINRSDTYSFGGTIVGDGAFVQMGSGTTILTNNNAYLGGTTIAAGTLQLGNGGASGSIIGNVVDNGTFAVNRSDTYTFGGAISGSGAFQQIGTGTTILTATNTYAGGTTITAGTLQLGNGGASGSIIGNVLDNGTFAINRSDTYTFGGVISGSGAFQQIGTGTTILTAVNAYSGGTAINGGVLAVAADANLGAASGGLAFDGGTLRFLSGFTTRRAVSLNAGGGTIDTNGNAVALAGVISGGGGLTKVGAGTLTLNGTSPYSGPPSVDAGTLVVNGSIANSAVTVNAGGRLEGTGTVGSTTIAGGATFAPGSGVPGSSMTVAGNLALQSGALYVVQVNPTTASFVTVTGTANLAGSLQLDVAPGKYVPRQYTILTSGGLTGSFSGVNFTNPNFSVNLSYTATDVILNFNGATLGAGAGLNQNQQNVANAISTFFNGGGDLPPAFASLFRLTGANLGNALSLLSGEPATGAQQAAFMMTNQLLTLMLDPFVDGRRGIAGGGPALGFAPERDQLPRDIALAFASLPGATATTVPSFGQRWSVWAAGYGGGNRTGGDPAVTGSHDLTARAGGVAAGIDYQFSPDAVFGFALAGGATNWTLAQGLGGGNSDAFQAGVYAAARSGPAYVAAALAFASQWMSTDRFAAFGDHLTARFNAQGVGARVESGYRLAMTASGITPYAALQAQGFHTPTYSETDLTAGGFGLTYNSRTAHDIRSELGARFDHVALVDLTGVLTLRSRLAWAHDWASDPSLAAAFQALPGPSFIVNGATPASNSLLASAGAELRLANGVTFLGRFDGELARHAQTYSGTGTVRWTW